ncbi:MAG TPA: hypothetical protein VN704_02610 [Verrucomicrobiae bacterium]|nr:hypothetical protein [Verrucomicrobiae bacterium]
MALSQTTLILICFVLLIYIAFIMSVSYFSGNSKNILDQYLNLDSALYNLVSTGTNYIHQTDTTKSISTILLNGQNFSKNQFLLIADSTPYASKGHIAITFPCNKNNPAQPIFQVLVGQAPDLFSMPLGYIGAISTPPNMCVYHGQFGFGDPVTDVALKYIGEGNLLLKGPYSIVLTTQEAYIPKAKSFEEIQHAQIAK